MHPPSKGDVPHPCAPLWPGQALAVLADRAYSSRDIRTHLRRRGIRAVSPQPSDQVGHRLRRGRFGGRPPGFNSEAYKQRNAVERCINRLKQWHGLATRTDKLARDGGRGTGT
ncbi:hypothetical protein SGFS_058560 [Streptomyces graminofaciens]|uniref:Transposase DDE domain-containing protein n=1 Tax=Streptomyces graminofaciens TaxID=68212 RepID=A0ABM7FDZ3_9ACTN|nr:hypothetical protein SGFS_058560 [Streptomyces graminofaciens]